MEMKSGDDVDVSVLKVEKIDEMPPDERRCCQTGGGGWRCKNFRINHDDDSVFKSIYCEKHYYGESEKWKNGTRVLEKGNKVSEEDETGGIQQITCEDITADAIVEGDSTKFVTKKKNGKRSGELKPLTKPVVETRAAKRRKMAMEADPIVECGSADDIQRKKKNVKRTKRSGELKSPTRAKEGVVELEKMGNYKMKCLELSLKLERKKLECTKLQSKLAEAEETRKTAETESTHADATASWEKMFSYLESRYQRKDNGNSIVESRISKLESLFLRMESKCKTTAGCVESRISKLESLVLGMENENSTMGCLESGISNLESLVQDGNLTMAVESRILKLESLVLRRNENSILRCGELRHSENIESEVLGLQNGVSGTDQKQRDNSKRRKPNAETRSRGRMDSHVYECQTKEKVLNVHHESESEFPKYTAVNISSGCLHLSSGRENVEEGNGRGCSDVVQSQHGSLSPDQLDMRKKLSVNWVSENGSQSFGESEDSDTSTDSGTSLGSLMDMLAMKYRDKNDNKEMKWKSEADMLSSIEEDPELCMRAVCALRRQQIYEDEMSEKGLFLFSDVLRITSLANFLMEEDCKGDLKKSLEELEIFDPKGVADCKRMARKYSFQLFSVYQNRKDPFFLPRTTASHGD